MTGQPIPRASYHGARAPDDIRRLPTKAYTELPVDLTTQVGALDFALTQPGLAYVKVEAKGYSAEIVEVVMASTERQTIPPIPLEPIAVQVRRMGEPVAAIVSVGFNRRTLIRPGGRIAKELAHHVQSGPLLKSEISEQDDGEVLLPMATAPGAPKDFDLLGCSPHHWGHVEVFKILSRASSWKPYQKVRG